MHKIMWKFVVKAEHINTFLTHYGPGGTWVSLFEKCPGFQGSELWQDAQEALVYYSVDSWDNFSTFQKAKQVIGSDYQTLDEQCAHLTRQEIPLLTAHVLSSVKSP